MPRSDDAPPARIAVLLAPDMRKKILTPQAERELAQLGQVIAPAEGELTGENMPQLLEGVRAVLTGWGTPPLTDDLLDGSGALGFVAHSAGSIHRLIPSGSIESGRLRVSHAAHYIAEAVAEYVLAQILMFLREPHIHDARLKAGDDWWNLRATHVGRLLGSQTVGIVGAGYVGRQVIKLLRAFGARVRVYDPMLSAERAAELGVEASSLDDLFAHCDIVSLHAPVLPETRHMIGAAQFALLREGALFVNSARAALVDQDAQLEALQSGRFTAALDVFDMEPQPADSPFFALSNTIVGPHTAGHSADTHLRQGTASVAEIRRFLAGEPLHHEITPAMLATMA